MPPPPLVSTLPAVENTVSLNMMVESDNNNSSHSSSSGPNFAAGSKKTSHLSRSMSSNSSSENSNSNSSNSSGESSSSDTNSSSDTVTSLNTASSTSTANTKRSTTALKGGRRNIGAGGGLSKIQVVKQSVASSASTETNTAATATAEPQLKVDAYFSDEDEENDDVDDEPITNNENSCELPSATEDEEHEAALVQQHLDEDYMNRANIEDATNSSSSSSYKNNTKRRRLLINRNYSIHVLIFSNIYLPRLFHWKFKHF